MTRCLGRRTRLARMLRLIALHHSRIWHQAAVRECPLFRRFSGLSGHPQRSPINRDLVVYNAEQAHTLELFTKFAKGQRFDLRFLRRFRADLSIRKSSSFFPPLIAATSQRGPRYFWHTLISTRWVPLATLVGGGTIPPARPRAHEQLEPRHERRGL